ncbi:metallo-dependent hydrolase [Synergistales bacterium]|nr:metallo-dependent hydrolase [Synergistales bacterium]
MHCSCHIKNGRVIDPARGINRIEDIYVSNGKIVTVPEEERLEVDETIDASGCMVLPGIIDFHTHLYNRHTELGIEPDAMTFPNGITSAVDAGSSGSSTFEGFYKDIVCSSFTTIKSFVNVSVVGVATNRFVENLNPKSFDVPALERLFDCYPEQILGLKLRMGKLFSGDLGLSPLICTKEIAQRLGVPMNVHVVNPEQTYDDILSHFSKGDVIVHCYQAKDGPQTILNIDGKLRASVKEARGRGVIFDAAAGRTLHDYNVIRQAFSEGFLPDILSSDVTASSIFKKPLHSLLYVMSMFLALEMPIEEIVRAVSETPAKLMGMSGQIGTLAPGASADISILRFHEKNMTFTDANQNTVKADKLFVPQMTLKAGRNVFRQIDFTF